MYKKELWHRIEVSFWKDLLHTAFPGMRLSNISQESRFDWLMLNPQPTAHLLVTDHHPVEVNKDICSPLSESFLSLGGSYHVLQIRANSEPRKLLQSLLGVVSRTWSLVVCRPDISSLKEYKSSFE